MSSELAAAKVIPAMAVLEVSKGKVLREDVWGVREAGTRKFAEVGDLWHIGSNAKPMTATLVASFVERRALSWSDRLADLLPELSTSMRPEFREATLVELVTHRSGLPANGELPNITRFYRDQRPRPEQRLDYLRGALMHAPAGLRGAYHYSNVGFIAAGAVVERVAGRSFEQLIRTELGDRLRMHTIGFGPTPRGQPLGHIEGRVAMPPDGDNPLMWAPAGGLHMSLGDWAKFAIDQMKGRRGRGRILNPEGYAFLQTAPEGQHSGADWGVQDKSFGKLLMHTGSNGHWYAITALAPDLENAVIIVSNTDEPKANALAERLFDRVASSWATRAD